MHTCPRRAALARRIVAAVLLSASSVTVSAARPPARSPITWAQLSAIPVPKVDHRIAYGSDSLQFGDLRLPGGRGPFPVAIVIHGGCWRSDFDLQHVGPLAGELTSRGIATWSIEYRRIGDPGGGWPGTFDDVARATDFVRELAKRHPLDAGRVVTIGHSAGGHLALWVATRRRVPDARSETDNDPLPIRGVVALAAISDLREYARGDSWCCQSVSLLMGGTPDSLVERYMNADPVELLSLMVPVRLVHGADDKIVPIEQSRSFARRASAAGVDARLVTVNAAGHFDVVAPTSGAIQPVIKAVQQMLRGGGRTPAAR